MAPYSVQDFKNAKRRNWSYHNTYGAHVNPRHPQQEDGGDRAALVRQSFSTPAVKNYFKNPKKRAIHGATMQSTGQNGLSRSKAVKLENEGDFRTPREENSPYVRFMSMDKNIKLAMDDAKKYYTDKNQITYTVLGLGSLLALVVLAI